MDRALGKGKGNNRRGANNSGKAVKAKGGAAPTNNNAPRKLSDRFDRIVHVAPASKAKKTQSQQQAKGKKAVVVVQKKSSNPKQGAKGKGNNASSGKRDNKKKDDKKGKAVAKPVKEKPKSADDLDLEMASYWHKAGKGPDPKLAKLDADMDSYFAEKSAAVTEVTEITEEVSTEAEAGGATEAVE